MKKLLTLSLSILAAGSLRSAPSVTAIPTLDGRNSMSSAWQITPDGKYVVGTSAQRGYLWQFGAATSVMVMGSITYATSANGVGYRTSGGVKEIIVRGSSFGFVTEWMTTDGVNFNSGIRRDTFYDRNASSNPNQMGSQLGSDAYFTVSRTANSGDTSPDISRCFGAWVPGTERGAAATTESARMNAASAAGRVAGRRLASSIVQNYTMYWTGPTTPAESYFRGLDGSNRGEAMGVSADGKVVVGGSPLLATDTDATIYPYKAVFPAWNNNSVVSVSPLPLLPVSHPSATKAIPFGTTGDGRWIVGYDYTGIYNAVLWDTADANPANWLSYDLTAYAAANNILNGFSQLTRAYSVGLDELGNPVIAGEGLYQGIPRAYAMVFVVPEPSALSLLGLGAFGLIAFRRKK